MGPFVVSSDIGGTFTDTVVIDHAGMVSRFKAPSVPRDPAQGVLETLSLAADEMAVSLRDFMEQIIFFSHGTTIATNAIIEGKRARVGLLQTQGFGDTLAIMRGFKSLGLDEAEIKNFRLLMKQPAILPKNLIAEVHERLDYQGRIVVPLDEENVKQAIRRLVQNGAEVFAVSLLWSFKNNTHEKRVAEIIRAEYPHSDITLSSELLPRLGEFSRSATVAINAGLGPVVRRAMESLDTTLRGEGLRAKLMIMQSNGGLERASEIPQRAATIIMSGPVGGVVASQYLGNQLDMAHVVTTDMGGTSFDVGIITNYQPMMRNVTHVGRDEVALPSVDVQTVGAGSGSIALVQDGYLTVGPDSAGADPGPACYGRGGVRPTVADADLVLGYINPDYFLGGRMTLSRELAVKAIDEYVATPLGMSPEEAAEGIKTIVDSRMADLIREVTIKRGVDPRTYTIFAFGGAGPSHAFSYAAELGISQVVMPFSASVHSAFGIATADAMAVEEISRPMQSPPGSTEYAKSLDSQIINDLFDALERKTLDRLEAAGLDRNECQILRFIEMRFRFQIHEITVELGQYPLTPSMVDQTVERFITVYESRFGQGSAFKAAGVEMVTFRVVAQGGLHAFHLQKLDVPQTPRTIAPMDERPVYQQGTWKTARIYQGRQLVSGAEIRGLAIVEMPDTTVVVGEDQTAQVDEFGNMILRL